MDYNYLVTDAIFVAPNVYSYFDTKGDYIVKVCYSRQTRSEMGEILWRRAIFVAPNVYSYFDTKGDYIVKVKGLSKEVLLDPYGII
jgi:hypothetical protein